MSTHNIGFYEDLTKIIFQLSSNIIKYDAPYLVTLMYLFMKFNLTLCLPVPSADNLVEQFGPRSF